MFAFTVTSHPQGDIDQIRPRELLNRVAAFLTA